MQKPSDPYEDNLTDYQKAFFEAPPRHPQGFAGDYQRFYSMKLEKVTIENFLQFEGRQELLFSTKPHKNVTLVHAENGFGKTVLLNAILWTFYGHSGLSSDFEKPEKILHDNLEASASDPRDVVARVTVLFEEDGDRYTLPYPRRRARGFPEDHVDAATAGGRQGCCA